MWALALFAADDPLRRPEIIYGVIALGGCLLAGAVVVSLVDKWRKRAAVTTSDDASVLSTYRDMYEQGEITEAEYTELRRKVAEKMKNSPGTKPPEPAVDANGRPNPAKFLTAIPPDSQANSSAPAPPAAPTESPPPPGTS